MDLTDKGVASARPRPDKRDGQVPARTLAYYAVDAALDKKARDILVMDVRGISGVTDFFVVCTGDSELQIKAIVDAVRDRLRTECDERTWHMEGYEHRQWVLLDYVDLVVHVFTEERRGFYELERLWGDAPREAVPDDGDVDQVALLQPTADAAETDAADASADADADADAEDPPAGA